MSKEKLTAMQLLFCEQMPICDFNATEAVRRAGYKNKNPDKEATRLMNKPHIRAHIDKLIAERSEKTGIDAEYVLARAVDMLDMCLGNKPVKKLIVSDGVPESMDVKEFNAAGAGKALELLGKHVNIGAFKDKIEHSGKVGVEAVSDEDLDERIAQLLNQ